jgi:hypothetical protein
MEWTSDKSVALSRCCIVVFALCLLALDAGAYHLAGWFVRTRLWAWQRGALLMSSIYCGSVFAWLCLYQLWRLLRSVGRGAVFTDENVRRMRVVSWCCGAAALISAVSAAYYLPFAFVAVAAGFMALIVRIVKNAFQQAITMKDELDLTV